MGKKAPLNWEFGDMWLWVAFGREKPFPVALVRKDGAWSHRAHPRRDLTDEQQDDLTALLAERQVEITDIWAEALERRLNWPSLEASESDEQHDER